MLILAFACLVLLSVVAAGGTLSRLAEVRLRGGWIVLLALAIQVVIITIVPGRLNGLHEPVHLATYAMAGIFIWANRNIAGIWLMGVGGTANFAAIAANGGVMPASPSALARAGMAPDKGEAFANSAALSEPRLAFLGDIFAIPAGWPLSNVFSLGDLCIALGILVAAHVLCEGRLRPSLLRRLPVPHGRPASSGSPAPRARR